VSSKLENLKHYLTLPASGLVLSLACAFILFWRTWVFSLHYWWDSWTYGHGILILPLSAYLIWTKRTYFQVANNSPNYLGLLVLTFFCFVWWFASLTDIEIILQLAFIGILIGIFWSLKGWKVTSVFLLPLMLPIMALPVWTPIVPILQYITTHVVANVLHWLSIPVYVESHYIRIPEGKISIEEVCAGLRYLLAAMTVALVYVYLYLRQTKYQLIYLLIVAVLSLAVNWIRVFVVILAGHLTNMTHYLVHNHANFGWWLFAFTLFPIFWAGGILVKKEQSGEKQTDPTREKSTDKSESHLVQNQSRASAAIHAYKIPSALTFILAIIVIGPAASAYIKAQAKHASTHIQHQLTVPAAGPGWTRSDLENNNPRFDEISMDVVKPRYLGADEEVTAVYQQQNHNVYLYLAKYYYQDQGKEMISEKNSPFDRLSWSVLSSTRIAEPLEIKDSIFPTEIVIKNKFGKSVLLWYWYSVNGTPVTNPLYAKILQFKDMLSTRKIGASVVVIAMEVTTDIESARVQLNAFLKATFSSLAISLNVAN